MTLSFKDTDGTRGRVTETLEVEYNGPWKEDVEECVHDIEKDLDVDRENDQADDPYTRLVLELPEKAPIIEVEQTDPR